jgi:maltose O-acetyltransferase
MKSERQKMLSGELYDPGDPELVSAHRQALERLQELNSTLTCDSDVRREILSRLFGRMGTGVAIQPPFYCDYGQNIFLGNQVFFNFNCVVLDVCEVRIGDHCLFGPAVQIYTATHPLDIATRRKLESGRPVTLGNDVWVGGGAILCPGITIGDGAVIGAGSVVTKSVPAGVLAAGNPCRVIRDLTAHTP